MTNYKYLHEMPHATVSKDKLSSNHVIFHVDLRFLELTDIAHKCAYTQLMLLQCGKESYTNIFQTDMRLALNEMNKRWERV